MDEKFDWKVYAPYFLGVSFALLLLFVWYLSALAIEESIVPVSIRLLFTGLFGLFTALVAAALGYLFNSRLNDKKAEHDRKLDKDKKEKEVIEALQSTLFLLSSKLYQLRCFYNFNMHRFCKLTEVERALKLPAFLPNIEIEPFSLIKLIPLQNKLGGDLINLSVLDQKYLTSYQALNNRSELYHIKIQSLLERWLAESNMTDAHIFYNNHFPRAHKKLYRELITSTNNCYELILNALDSFESMQCKLLALAQETYPEEDFFDLTQFNKNS